MKAPTWYTIYKICGLGGDSQDENTFLFFRYHPALPVNGLLRRYDCDLANMYVSVFGDRGRAHLDSESIVRNI
jgi:hypothetical protein